MIKKSSRFLILFTILTLPFLLLGQLLPNASGQTPPHIGYGFNVNEWDITQLQNMGFDWIKVFNTPSSRLPVNVLIRIDANHDSLNNLAGFGAEMSHLAGNHGAYIEAYEIGNEPNLDASYGWNTSPNAVDYVTVLCEAYQKIKAVDPDSIIVSAGLAPTGRVQGNWHGHAGHNGLYQDERAFFQEFLDAGGANCADVFGYHPYGYSANFDAEPDVPSNDPTENCANGFCFRGVEKLYEMMVANGLADRQIWGTEYGWIIEPPTECLADPSWQGRLWQIVSEQQQADNLAGSFQYADAHMPYMGAMFVFNLNFNEAGHLPLCDQMRFYGVVGRQAEGALRDMPKNPVLPAGELAVPTTTIHFLAEVGQQPITLTTQLLLENVGDAPLDYLLSGSGELLPTFPTPTGSLPAGNHTLTPVLISSQDRPSGDYDGEMIIHPSAGSSVTIPIQLHLVTQSHKIYLPAVIR